MHYRWLIDSVENLEIGRVKKQANITEIDHTGLSTLSC